MQDALTDLDRHLGGRLRTVRRNLGLTPTELASRLGLSEMKIELYESGRARMAANDLIEIAGLLGVSVGYFFSDEDKTEAPRAWPPPELDTPRPTSRESFNLIRAFKRIPSPAERRRIIRLVEALGRKSPSLT
jgi:transcriptional regulator with XRE-family HTH domain